MPTLWCKQQPRVLSPAPCTEFLLVRTKSRGLLGEGAPAPCTEFLLVSIKNRGWCGFSPRVGIFTKIYIKKQPAAFRKSTKRKQRAVRSWVFGENARHDSAKGAGFSPTYG